MSAEGYHSSPEDMESEASFDSTGKRKSFRRLIKRFADKTSMQGPPYINMAKLWWAKLIWAILLLSAVAAMILHLWYLFSQWYSWPKTTVISLGFDDLAFPQVTICNTNVLHKNRFDKHNGAKELKMLVEDLKPENFVPHQFNENYDPNTDKKIPPGRHRQDANKQGNQPAGAEQGGNEQGGTEQGGNQPGGNEQGGNQPGESEQGGSQPDGAEQGGNQSGGTEQGGNQPGGEEQGGNQPDGGEQGGNQSGGAEQGGNQTGGGEQGGNLPGDAEQGGNQSGGAEQGGNQPGGAEQGGNQQGGNDQGMNQPNGTDQEINPPVSTQPATNGGDQQGENVGTTQAGRTRRNRSTTQAVPRSRKKRYDSTYEYLNVSDYVEDYPAERENDIGLDSPIDSQTKLEKVFRELYMDIDKSTRENLGHHVRDMLVGCTFNGRRCGSGFFQLHQTAEYGNCWTISSDKFIVGRSGPGGGLSLVLFLETSEYLKGLTTGYGARIQFQEQDTYPFPFDEGVYISGAMETDIGIKLKTISRLGGDYGSCNDGVEFMKLYNLTYTRRACQAFCRITTVIKNCKCFDDNWEEFAFKKDATLRPCRSLKEKQCQRGVLQEFRSGAFTCTCENPCRETDYVKSVSARQWPTDEYARVLLDWLCDKDADTCKKLRKEINNIWHIKNNFLKLNIYYEDLNFENITETAQIELQQFLSDIGGAFGLWIGLSILSLCEVIQLFVELFGFGIHKTKHSQNADTNSKDKDSNKSPENLANNEKEPDNKLPRFTLNTTDRLPRHMRDESPFRDYDSSYHSDTGSYDSRHKRKNDIDPYGSHSPNLRFHRGSPYLHRRPYLEPDSISFHSDRGNDRSPHRHRRRSRSHGSPRRDRKNKELFDNHSNLKDYMGLDRPSLFY